MLCVNKIAFLLILTLSLQQINSQTKQPFYLGIGLNTNLGYGFSKKYTTPRKPNGLPYGPTINLKYLKHELIVGADLYRIFTRGKYRIVGTQASYRYHFYRENKKLNPFLDINLQYSQFAYGTAFTVPYNYSDKNSNINSYSIYKCRSLFNTYGVGIEIEFIKNFSFHSALGFGFNYLNTKIDYSGELWFKPNYIPNNVISAVMLRAGIVYSISKQE